MKKSAVFFIAGLVLVAVLAIVIMTRFGGALPAITPSPVSVEETIPAYQPGPAPLDEPPYEGPLHVPSGFDLRVYASGFRTPRILGLDPAGRIAVSDIAAGTITLLEERSASIVRTTLVSGLDRPHGFEFHDGYLYIAETKAVSRYRYDAQAATVGAREKLFDLPFTGGHFTRTLRFGADGALYVSIGSSCNVCREADERLASVMRYEPGTWRGSVYARGLRNTVGLTLNPATKELWGVDNGRDWLGDSLPPEDVNIIRAGGDYGWPICYGNKIHDSNFDKNQYFRDPCADTTAPVFELPAHTAPLGLAFIDSRSFPAGWQGDLLVTMHGSWNRSVPDGYKVVRLFVDGDRVTGSEDFITGFIANGAAIGRPVDVLFGPDGAAYITDDKAGVIYRVTHR